MEVNFNNIRKQACIAYDKLTAKLNANLNDENNIIIDARDIQENMDDLRMMICLIALCYEEGDPDKVDVYTQLYWDDGGMESFNPNTEE